MLFQLIRFYLVNQRLHDKLNTHELMLSPIPLASPVSIIPYPRHVHWNGTSSGTKLHQLTNKAPLTTFTRIK